jgi:hypothetical protein
METNLELSLWISTISGLSVGLITGLMVWALDKNPLYMIPIFLGFLGIAAYGVCRLKKLMKPDNVLY